jgi:hypothetical protein
MGTGISSSEIKWPGREPDRQPSSKAEVKNCSANTSTRVIMANSFITGPGKVRISTFLYFRVPFIEFMHNC